MVELMGHPCFPIKSIIAKMRYVSRYGKYLPKCFRCICTVKCDSCFIAQSCFCISSEGIRSKLTETTNACAILQMSLEAHGRGLAGPVSLPLQNTGSNPSRETGQIPHESRVGVLAGVAPSVQRRKVWLTPTTRCRAVTLPRRKTR